MNKKNQSIGITISSVILILFFQNCGQKQSRVINKEAKQKFLEKHILLSSK